MTSLRSGLMVGAPARYAARRESDSGYLAILFLVLLVVLAAGAWNVVRFTPTDTATADRISRALGITSPERVREGFDPSASTAGSALDVDLPATPPLSGLAPAPPSDAGAPPARATTGGVAPALVPGQQAQVANTDGLGVVLRTKPRDDARVPRGLAERARVTILERDGPSWVLVRAENGLEGWVPAQYLASLP